MKKVAVTLANGQLGCRVIQQLIKRIGKENVVGIVRNPEKTNFLNIEVRKGDYNNPIDFKSALQDIDTLLLISGLDAPKVRIKQHQNIINAAKRNKVSKIVFTSVIGAIENTSFKPILESNRQTESDIINTNINWSIGRNSLYIEPDLEYIETYKNIGVIINSAGTGKCGYTNRNELAKAYTEMLLDDKHNSKVYSLLGKPITQQELADCINKVYATNLTYKSIAIEEYLKDRKSVLGKHLGTIVGSIYENINKGSFDVKSDFEKVARMPHKSPLEMIEEFKKGIR